MITRQSDAWFLLAEDYRPEDDRGQRVFLCDWIKCLGIYGNEGFRDAVQENVRESMVRRIQLDVGSGEPAYGYDLQHKNDTEARRLACLVFGWEARDRERSPLRRQRSKSEGNR